MLTLLLSRLSQAGRACDSSGNFVIRKERERESERARDRGKGIDRRGEHLRIVCEDAVWKVTRVMEKRRAVRT